MMLHFHSWQTDLLDCFKTVFTQEPFSDMVMKLREVQNQYTAVVTKIFKI
jgi:hypothetical protein